MNSKVITKVSTSNNVNIASSNLPIFDKSQRDDINKIQQDINIIQQKINDLKGISTNIEPNENISSGGVTGISPFVVNIRSLTDSDRKFKDFKDLKIATIETLLEKISEYDRLLLKQTSPPVENNSIPQRRKSIGMDLFSLPTHLHITSRLLDLHTQSQRITVIKTTEKTNSNSINNSSQPNNSQDKKQLDEMKITMSQLIKQVEDLNKKIILKDEECNKSKTLNNELKNKIIELEKISKKTPEITLNPEYLNTQINEYKNKIIIYEKTIDKMQEKLEAENGHVSSILNVILQKADRYNNSNEIEIHGDDCINLSKDMKNGFNLLETAIYKRFQCLKSELTLMISIKDLLESEVNSINLQKEFIQKDLLTITEHYDALKAAYHALSYETASVTQKEVKNDDDNNNIEIMKKSLENSEDHNKQLQSKIIQLDHKILELEKWPNIVISIEEKLNLIIHEKQQLESLVINSKDEVMHYKKLTETLKEKLKKLSHNNADNKQFLDSFEEVMQDEMMTMKAAFESKLRLAKEESDAISKKHQQEILRMSAASPYAALARINK